MELYEELEMEIISFANEDVMTDVINESDPINPSDPELPPIIIG